MLMFAAATQTGILRTAYARQFLCIDSGRITRSLAALCRQVCCWLSLSCFHGLSRGLIVSKLIHWQPGSKRALGEFLLPRPSTRHYLLYRILLWDISKHFTGCSFGLSVMRSAYGIRSIKYFMHGILPSCRRAVGESISGEGFPVLAVVSVVVISWVLPKVYIIDLLGLNDYVIARTPRGETED